MKGIETRHDLAGIGSIISPEIKNATNEVDAAGKHLSQNDTYLKSATEDRTANFLRRRLALAGQELQSLIPKDRNADLKSLPPAALLYWLNQISGADIYLHEQWGHVMANNLLWQNGRGEIQVDAIDNIKNFRRKPSIQNFNRIITEHDLDKNHVRGWAAPANNGKPSEIGKIFSAEERVAIGYAAGSIVEDIPSFMAFAAGFKLRKQHPLLGYTLMTFGTINHLRNSLYPLTAVIPQVQNLGMGHDWTNFASLTGIHPLITASLFSLSLPLFAFALHSVEKRQEEHVKERIALANLLENKKISLDELQSAYSRYEGRAAMNRAEDALSEILDTPREKLDEDTPKMLRKSLKNLGKEYSRFTEHLISVYRKDIIEEKKRMEQEISGMSIRQSLSKLKDSIKYAWSRDRLGTALTGSSMAAGGSVMAGLGCKQLLELIRESRNISTQEMPTIFDLIRTSSAGIDKFLSKAVPIVGLLGAADSFYQAGKTLNNKEAATVEKGLSICRAIFSGIGASAVMFSGLAIPLVLISIAGQLGAFAGKIVYDRLVD